jgi:hypothetical protein
VENFVRLANLSLTKIELRTGLQRKPHSRLDFCQAQISFFALYLRVLTIAMIDLATIIKQYRLRNPVALRKPLRAGPASDLRRLYTEV